MFVAHEPILKLAVAFTQTFNAPTVQLPNVQKQFCTVVAEKRGQFDTKKFAWNRSRRRSRRSSERSKMLDMTERIGRRHGTKKEQLGQVVGLLSDTLILPSVISPSHHSYFSSSLPSSHLHLCFFTHFFICLLFVFCFFSSRKC